MDRDAVITQLTQPGGSFELRSEPESEAGALRVYVRGPHTLRDVLLATRSYGERTFLVYEDERISYEQHFFRAARLAHWLLDNGIDKGDRVAIGMRNYPEWAVSFFACQAIGAVAVTLNAWWTPNELTYGLVDSEANAALLDGERYAGLRARKELEGVAVLVARSGSADAALSFDEALARYAGEHDVPDVDVQPADYASIMYTSGTTGVPKGALHSHRNHVTNLQNTLLAGAVGLALAPTPPPDPPPQPASLQTFPFFHIGGLSGLYISAISGAKLVLMYRWDVERAFDLISREQVRSWSGVPTVVRQLLEHPRAESGALDSLASIASGGAPVPQDLIERVGRLFEARVAPGNGYGATETTSAIIANGGADYLARPNSVGRPVVTVDVRVVDDQGIDCARGVVGELWVRGPNVFAGYWNKPEETAAAFSDGWFRTGDLGYCDDEGFYFVVDRKKDVIIRGGENVYCAEVEGVLHRHPAIADVALIGLPHRVLGEEVAAVVERKPGVTLDEADVQAYVAEHLARFNVPTQVFFIDEPLPRTATGKVLKRQLKERWGQGTLGTESE